MLAAIAIEAGGLMETQRRAEPLKQVAASFGSSYDTFFRAATEIAVIEQESHGRAH